MVSMLQSRGGYVLVQAGSKVVTTMVINWEERNDSHSHAVMHEAVVQITCSSKNCQEVNSLFG